MEKYIQENLIKDGQEKLNNKELKIVQDKFIIKAEEFMDENIKLPI